MKQTDHLPGLDLLRSIAIVWVMLFHSFVVGGLGPDWSWLSRFGWMGVDLFFVLSGFLIGTQVLSALRPQHLGVQTFDGSPAPLSEAFPWRDFYLRRALRILPAYWVVWGLYAFWPALREAPGMEPGWKFVLFVLNLSIDYSHHAAFSHAWSLCVEEHFYAVFPLLAVALLRRPALWKFATLVGVLVLGGIALRAVLWAQGMAADPQFSRNWYVEDLYYPTWNRLDGLLCGVVLAAGKTLRPQTWQRARRYANHSLLAGLLLLSLAIVLFQNRVGWLGNTVGWPVLSLGMGLLVFAGAGRDSLIGRCQLPGVGWLAALSYSLYLVHKAAYHAVAQQWGDALAGTGVLAFSVYGGAAVLAAVVLHYAVERPGLRLRHRWLKRSPHRV